MTELLALPPRLGGIGLINPAIALQNELERSVQTCAPLADRIRNQESRLGDVCQLVASNRATASVRRKQIIADAAATLRATLPAPLQRNMDIFSDKGASHWLTILPVTSHGFSLRTSAFRDALCMCYNWQPDHLPSHCACGQAFSIDHALSCATGGNLVLRHNELRNFTSSVLQEVCHDVALEPPLQPLDGELLLSNANVTKEARLDISARGFWGDRFSRSLFDVRVFHATQTLPLQLQRRFRASTPNTNPARDASTSRESVRWWVQDLCHWFSRPLEEWGLLVKLPSSVSPACSAESSTVSMPPR